VDVDVENMRNFELGATRALYNFKFRRDPDRYQLNAFLPGYSGRASIFERISPEMIPQALVDLDCCFIKKDPSPYLPVNLPIVNPHQVFLEFDTP